MGQGSDIALGITRQLVPADLMGARQTMDTLPGDPGSSQSCSECVSSHTLKGFPLATAPHLIMALISHAYLHLCIALFV